MTLTRRRRSLNPQRSTHLSLGPKLPTHFFLSHLYQSQTIHLIPIDRSPLRKMGYWGCLLGVVAVREAQKDGRTRNGKCTTQRKKLKRQENRGQKELVKDQH
ncbi:hypothetical protein GE21DRAFT_1068194 [Neurospora crassa]|nr:hypothetical protein GE21DRAFT_1068194 [Neurospora crassa]